MQSTRLEGGRHVLGWCGETRPNFKAAELTRGFESAYSLQLIPGLSCPLTYTWNRVRNISVAGNSGYNFLRVQHRMHYSVVMSTGSPVQPIPQINISSSQLKRTTCNLCCGRKVRCDRTKPECLRCKRAGHRCVYPSAEGEAAKLNLALQALHYRLGQSSSRDSSSTTDLARSHRDLNRASRKKTPREQQCCPARQIGTYYPP